MAGSVAGPGLRHLRSYCHRGLADRACRDSPLVDRPGDGLGGADVDHLAGSVPATESHPRGIRRPTQPREVENHGEAKREPTRRATPASAAAFAPGGSIDRAGVHALSATHRGGTALPARNGRPAPGWPPYQLRLRSALALFVCRSMLHPRALPADSQIVAVERGSGIRPRCDGAERALESTACQGIPQGGIVNSPAACRTRLL